MLENLCNALPTHHHHQPSSFERHSVKETGITINPMDLISKRLARVQCKSLLDSLDQTQSIRNIVLLPHFQETTKSAPHSV